MRLVYESNGEEVVIGDQVTLHNSTGTYVVTDIRKPHKPGSTGRVYVKLHDGRPGSSSEYFPSVIGAHWIEREDQE